MSERAATALALVRSLSLRTALQGTYYKRGGGDATGRRSGVRQAEKDVRWLHGIRTNGRESELEPESERASDATTYAPRPPLPPTSCSLPAGWIKVKVRVGTFFGPLFPSVKGSLVSLS